MNIDELLWREFVLVIITPVIFCSNRNPTMIYYRAYTVRSILIMFEHRGENDGIRRLSFVCLYNVQHIV